MALEWLPPQLNGIVGQIKPTYFYTKRWFGSKSRQISGVHLVESAMLPEYNATMLHVQIEFAEGAPELYFLPLVFQLPDVALQSVKFNVENIATTVTDPHGQELWAYDALMNEAFCKALYEMLYKGQALESTNGQFNFKPIAGRLTQADVTSLKWNTAEQSHTSIIYNSSLILKVFRKLTAGKNPDVEVPLFLSTHTDFQYVPALSGVIEYESKTGEVIPAGVLQAFVKNEGDGRAFTLEQIPLYFKQVEQYRQTNPNATPQPELAAQFARDYAASALRLGQITAEMHQALASDAANALPDFAPELITTPDIEGWKDSITALIRFVIGSIRQKISQYEGDLRRQLETIASHEAEYLKLVDNLDILQQEQIFKTRFHGDYHLVQVLKTGADFVILDFEGEPARSLAERRAKHCPLKDVAGMLRSLDYNAYSGLFAYTNDTTEQAQLEGWLLAWEAVTRKAFLDGYLQIATQPGGAQFLPSSEQSQTQAIKVFELEKAFYELNYEFNNRLSWVPIPLKGLLRLLSEDY